MIQTCLVSLERLARCGVEGAGEADVELERDGLEEEVGVSMRIFGRGSRRTHIKLIILAHLGHQLPSDPFLHLGRSLAIQPTPLNHGPDNPFRLGLLPQDEAQSGVVGQAPESEIDEEEVARGLEGEEEEERELEAEEGEGEDVDVLWWW